MLKALFLGFALLTGVTLAKAINTPSELASDSINQLEQRRVEIDAELDGLAQMSLRSGVGAVGYRSTSHREPDTPEWIHIYLETARVIDQVVLVPTIGRDSKLGLQSDGFPLEFRILAGTDSSTNVVASFTAADHLLPRIAPVVVPFDRINASWVRIECTLLSPRRWMDNHHSLQLSEILIFSGNRNVALHKKVDVSSSHIASAARDQRFLVDGFVPYLMDAASGEKSPAASYFVKEDNTQPTITIDLGAIYPTSQINLHAVDLSHTIPEAAQDDHAIPRLFTVSGANRADFSDATVLITYERKSIYDAGPTIKRNFPETNCRYIKLTALDIQPSELALSNRKKMGFAEIEVISRGINVALNRPVTVSDDLDRVRATKGRITDGNNFYGEILPDREWMSQLALRHDLETERPRVTAELAKRYAKQKAKLRIALVVVGVLLGGGVILILIEQMLRQRAIHRTRERIAANLHDELGANLHAIGLFGSLARQEVEQEAQLDKWKKLIEYTDTVCALTKETGATARYCTNMLESKDLYADFEGEIKRLANRLLADMQHTISLTNQKQLNKMPARRRSDLFLFYKECLTNILRHSGATRVETDLSITDKILTLSVSDNGSGLSMNEAPLSLRRRARLLRANVDAVNVPAGGTRITLKLHTESRKSLLKK